ncbi:type II secretion system protein GspE [candidate division TM6 bacterium RIFCSPHIGHO2_12_FULL_36_22]|nr:MAG: type II secretion system protein GspE [candidate division TM6 bacterium RIFCSPHIGHO2_12_FULL_36_22]
MLKSLGDILVEQKALTPEQRDTYTQKAQELNQPLEEYLAKENLVTSEVLAQAVATQLHLPYIDTITEQNADPKLMSKVPFNFLRANRIAPIKKDGKVYLLTADPLNYQAIDEVNMMLDEKTQLAISTEKIISDGVNRFYPVEGTKEMMEDLAEEEQAEETTLEFGEMEETDILGMGQEAPIIKLVNHILLQAVKRGASDIHIEPYEKEIHVRYRIDGVMHVAFTPPKRVQNALISRIKIMANLNIAEKRLPQDGRIQIKVAEKTIDIRVSVLPITFGERIVMRLLDKSKTFGNLQNLGFSKRDYQIILSSIERPNGIILLTGPTGSGKTSTLYSILNKLNRPEVNIITVEDPVEYQIAGISQVQVNTKVGLTFAAALRSILRQDPDIIMIGETRDFETAQIAIQASLTGHLVLSTLHTNSAPGAITRLTDMGIEPFLIASTVSSVIAQRLVRRLCDKCKEKYKPSTELIKSLGISQKEADTITFYKAVGCPDCSNTGYKGRIAIFEVMAMTPEVALLTMDRADTHLIQKEAEKQGMKLLIQDGIEKIKEGLTSIDEVLSVAAADNAVTESDNPITDNESEKK